MNATLTANSAPTENLPGPRDTRVGFPVKLANDPLTYLETLSATYGDVSGVRLGGFRACLLNHPDLVQEILVTNARNFAKGEGLQRAKRLLGEGLLTSEGEFHLKQRRLLQPVFLRSRIQNYATAMGSHALAQNKRWEDGQTVDMAREMSRLTLAVVGTTLFSADLGGQASQIGGALDTAIELFNIMASPLTPLYDLLPFGPGQRFRKARAQLDASVLGLIAERHRNGGGSGDVLDLLLESRYDDGSAMDDEQVRDEAMTIFLAGHETTANALAWTWLLLARNPWVQERLGEEARRVLGGRAPVLEDMESLTYTRQVVQEGMRLLPPASIIGRRALSDFVVEHEGHRYHVAKDTLVVVSQWLLHRDARFWPEPERFWPERWTAEAEASRPRFAYFPFGAGGRQCIGEGFAWMEAVLLLAGLAQDWRATLAPGAIVTPQPRITMRPLGLQMILERRRSTLLRDTECH